MARLYTTVQLREGDDRDVQLLRQSFERARDRADLLLTAAEVHTAGIHQLQIVDDDALNIMFPHQSTGFRTQLKNRKTWRIIHIDRGIIQFLDLEVELFPLIFLQATTLDLLARYLADIHDQTIHQLHIAHLQREECHRNLKVDRHVLRHREHESGLTHRRTRRDDHQVGVLPTRGDLIQSIKPTAKAAHTALLVRCLFQHRERLLDHRVDLRHILFHVALRDLEERPLRLLHQVVHIHRLVERLVLDGRREANQLTSQVFLGDNAGMKLQVRRTGHLAGQL